VGASLEPFFEFFGIQGQGARHNRGPMSAELVKIATCSVVESGHFWHEVGAASLCLDKPSPAEAFQSSRVSTYGLT
jgi:hypothetical protein